MVSRLRIRVYGIVGIAFIVLVVAVLLGMYQKVFTSYVHVTVVADRAGLLLDRGAAVRAFGLSVGEVRSAKVVGDHVEIETVIDADDAKNIPADAGASIQATTVFGAKFIALDIPERRVSNAIEDGQVLRSGGTSVEANDVFQNGLDVIEAVDPIALNTTLTSMAKAFQGRGERLGLLLERSDDYLVAFNQHLPALEDALETAPGVTETYADVVPGFLDTADQASTTARTLSKKQSDLHDSLEEFAASGRVVQHFLDVSEEPLDDALQSLRPTTGLVATYAPALTCIVKGLEAIVNQIGLGIGNQKAGIHGLVAILPAMDPYTYPKNLPQFALGVGPACRPLPSDKFPHQPRMAFQDGTQDLYLGPSQVEVRPPINIYEDAFSDWFGDNLPLGNFLDLLRKNPGGSAP